jgi:hypothetical protein
MKWLLLVLVGGCSLTAAQKREDLMDDLRDYQEGLVWKRYDRSAGYLQPGDREAFLDAHEAADDEMIVDEYEIQRVTLEHGHEEAKVQVKYRWHLDSEGIVKETVVEEAWTAKNGKSWSLVDAWRKHGQPMPSIHDAPEAPQG